MEKLCDKVHITLNKNAVQGDRSAMSPGGVRIGSPALTTRGMKEPEFRQIADFMARAADLGLKIQQASGKLLKDFTIAIEVGPDVAQIDSALELLLLLALLNCQFFYYRVNPLDLHPRALGHAT